MGNRLIAHEALCISDGKLVQYKEDSLPIDEKNAISSHLVFCDACLMRLEMLADSTEKYEARVKAIENDTNPIPIPASLQQALENFKVRAETIRSRRVELSEVLDKEGLQVGQVWRPTSKNIVVPTPEREERCSVFDLGSKPCFVVITDNNVRESAGYHIVRVAIITTDIEAEHIGACDIVVNDSNFLAQPFVIQSWNQMDMLRENLEYCVGNVRTVIDQDAYAQLITKEHTNSLAEQYSLETFIKRGEYSIPLARYRARSYEETMYLRVPVEALQEAIANQAKPASSEQYMGRSFKPGEVVNFFGIANPRSIKEIRMRLIDPSGTWVPAIMPTLEMPAAASGGSALLPPVPPFKIGNCVFQLEQGRADLKTKQTSFRLNLVEGNSYPTPRVHIVLVTDTGEVIEPEAQDGTETADHSTRFGDN